MPKPTAQQCHALTTYYVNQCLAETGKNPTFNRNKVRWLYEGLLTDYTTQEAKELIDYYLKSYSDPSMDWFLYNYDKVDEAKKDKQETESRQARRRKETQERLEEWRNKW